MSVEKIKLKHNSPEWLAFRRKGIGASDAAAVLGLSKWTTNVELWEEKVGLRQPKNLSDNEHVRTYKMATMELVLSTPIEQLAPKLIAWNNAELLAQVNKSLENYKGKVYDENSIAEAKTDSLQKRQEYF